MMRKSNESPITGVFGCFAGQADTFVHIAELPRTVGETGGASVVHERQARVGGYGFEQPSRLLEAGRVLGAARKHEGSLTMESGAIRGVVGVSVIDERLDLLEPAHRLAASLSIGVHPRG